MQTGNAGYIELLEHIVAVKKKVLSEGDFSLLALLRNHFCLIVTEEVLDADLPDTPPSMAHSTLVYGKQGLWEKGNELIRRIEQTELLGEVDLGALASNVQPRVGMQLPRIQREGRRAGTASNSGFKEGAWAGKCTHFESHGKPRVDVPTSWPEGGGGAAGTASTGDEKACAWEGVPRHAEKYERPGLHIQGAKPVEKGGGAGTASNGARQCVLGMKHVDTLTSMANLAITYSHQGRWKEAEELELQVLERRQRVLGTEHADTLTSMANLARVYSDQG